MQNNFQDQGNKPSYTVKGWLKVTAIAVLNVIILGFFAGYFENQQLTILGLIGIVADSMSIVLGLLGIWFFFLSENLNRTTAINLERTTSTVNDLREQMWEMIQKTFNTFVEKDNKEKVAGAKEALQQLKEQVQNDKTSVSSEILTAIDKISDRINTLEERDKLFSKPLQKTLGLEGIQLKQVADIVIQNFDSFPMRAGDFYEIIRSKLGSQDSPGSFMAQLEVLGYFDVINDANPDKKMGNRAMHGDSLIDISPAFAATSLPPKYESEYTKRRPQN